VSLYEGVVDRGLFLHDGARARRQSRPVRSWIADDGAAPFAAAARRNRSRRITIGSARCWPRMAPDAVRRIHGLMARAPRRCLRLP
jgi:hypothetical protein